MDAGTENDGSVTAFDAGHDAGHDSGPSCVNVTVQNTSVWCSVSVNGGGFSSAPSQSVCVGPGTVQLDAAPLSSTFILGPWHGSDGDTGSGEVGNVTGSGASAHSTASLTIPAGSADKCVWICCPFANGTGCPTANQCP